MPNRYHRKRCRGCFNPRSNSYLSGVRAGNPLSRPLRFEPLEDRRLLSVDLVSRAVVPSATGWGDSSISPNALSADGRYAVFISDASNLASGVAIASGVQNIYRFDRVTGEVLLVSVNAAGTASGNGASTNPVISADGNVVAFQSDANNLHPLDTNSDEADVFARNLATNTTHLVSINAAGTGSGNRASINPVISADGNVVAFLSSSSNLHTLDTSLLSDFFARNLATGTTYLVSVDSTGTGGGNSNVPIDSKPVISADGTVVAFQSTASNLHVLDNDTGLDIFARNFATGTTHLVSINTTGTESGKGFSYNPVISADGNVVAFESLASNLHSLRSTRRDIFARNLATDTTYLVSVDVTGTTGGNSDSLNPVISADGNVVAFESGASNLHALSTPSRSGIFARNLTTGTTYLVSVNVSGTGRGDYDSTKPVISADGNIVAFQSSAKNVHVLDANSSIEEDIFARNLTTGTTYLVSVDATATSGGNSDSTNPVISADGNVVAFENGASNLINRDYNVSADVFVRDIGNGGTQAASSRHPERRHPRRLAVHRRPTRTR
jgi:Tol biopolymer transport system component